MPDSAPPPTVLVQPNPSLPTDCPELAPELPTGTLTFLLTDIEGSTALWEQDERAMRAGMARHDALVAKALSAHGGRQVKERGEGDSIFAVFTSPLQALAAACALQQALLVETWPTKTPLRLRMGLHTGEAAVREGDYHGVVVNRCARIRALGHGGQILLSAATAQLVRDALPEGVGLRALGAHRLPGLARPEVVAQVLHPALPAEYPPLRSLLAPKHNLPAASASFVGREREFALLDEHLAAQGPPVLLLAGEPGMGKTSLLRMAAQHAREHGFRVLEGGCVRRGGQEPFAPLLDALERHIRQQLPIQRQAELRGCAWLARLLPELAAEPIEQIPAWIIPPEQERRLMFAAVARFLSNVAGPAGTLLVLDDLQWAGADALELLATVVRPGLEGQVLVLGSYRDTEVRPGDPLSTLLADLAHTGAVRHHTLAPLSAEEVGQLLDALLAAETVRPETHARIVKRAGGVPFFVVSCAQGLHVSPVDGQEDAVPWNVAQGIRQRVAALPEAARELLSVAAVVGRVVPPAVLVAAAARPEEDVLAALEAASRAGLLRDEGHAYHFTHDVIREVIENDLGTARRLLLHRRVAVAIEGEYASRLAEHYETLAYHYRQGEAWEQAIKYLVRSGDKARAANAIQEALRLYDQALTLCDMLGVPALAAAVDAAQKRGAVLSDSGDFRGAAADYARMRDAAIGLGDRRREGMALAHRGTSLFYGHDFEEAEETLKAALTVAADVFDDVRFFAGAQLCSLLATTNRHAEAAPLLAAVEELAPRVDDPYSQAWWCIIDSEVLHWAGHYDESLALLRRWRGAAQASNQIIVLLWHGWEEAIARGGKGEYTRALALLDEVLATCDRIGEAVVAARAANTAGWICVELQDHQRALALNGRSLEVAASIEVADTEIRSNARLNLGDSLAALGRLDEAEEHFLAVEHVVRHPRPQDHWMLWRYAQHLFHSYGELWLVRGAGDRALAYADECLRLAESSDSRKNIVKARRLRGQVFLARGALSEAETELGRALAVARPLANPPQLWQTLVTIGDLRREQNRLADSRQAYEEAQSIIDGVAAGLDDQSLRETFLASAHVQRIRQG